MSESSCIFKGFCIFCDTKLTFETQNWLLRHKTDFCLTELIFVTQNWILSNRNDFFDIKLKFIVCCRLCYSFLLNKIHFCLYKIEFWVQNRKSPIWRPMANIAGKFSYLSIRLHYIPCINVIRWSTVANRVVTFWDVCIHIFLNLKFMRPKLKPLVAQLVFGYANDRLNMFSFLKFRIIYAENIYIYRCVKFKDRICLFNLFVFHKVSKKLQFIRNKKQIG